MPNHIASAATITATTVTIVFEQAFSALKVRTPMLAAEIGRVRVSACRLIQI